MEAELKSLKIDRSKKRAPQRSNWATRWIIAGVILFLLAGAGRYAYTLMNAPLDVEIARVRAASSDAGSGNSVILNATGYIVAHHKIQVAAKVVGRVSWIGVDKAYKVTEGQVIARLEDDEYRAQVQQAKGNLENLQAKLLEMTNGSRPEEIAVAKANLDSAKADLENFKITLARSRQLVAEKVSAQQVLDDAIARYESQERRVGSLERTYEIARLGPRKEQIDAVRGQIEQARGVVAYAQTQLDNTIIKAPSAGTVLERAVEKGEFVTTNFVGDKGAKGYIISLADLNDLQVELDISQNDFRKLGPRQKGVVTTDAFPDLKYEGVIDEISPEANRQKATVQVKVKVLKPDDHLRPEMNASVAFYNEARKTGGARQKPLITIPSSAVRAGGVFVVLNGKAIRRVVKTGGSNASGVIVEEGLIGGEDLILNPPADLKDGTAVREKKR
jgi:HlyD family secretion protein